MRTTTTAHSYLRPQACSLLSLRAATTLPDLHRQAPMVSIRAARAGRDLEPSVAAIASRDVSIRAPRAGRDRRISSWCTWPACFYPRAPGGARQGVGLAGTRGAQFLSARPGRGATSSKRICIAPWWRFLSARPGRGATSSMRARWSSGSSFYPRAPGGARPVLSERMGTRVDVSIRAPRAGRDALALSAVASVPWFLSARPGRGATSCPGRCC